MVLETIGLLMAKKGLEATASEGVKTLIDTHVKPILQRHAEIKDNSYEIEVCLREYLEIVYKKAMIMNTIVFRGVNKTLCDLYIPLTIVNSNQEDEQENICIDDNCLNNFVDMEKILIVDTAGMGKSTITKFLIVKYITENNRIPILIELRKLKGKMEILDYIVDQFELMGKRIDKDDIVHMLRKGDFVIFFDGYDEIENELKGDLMDEIQEFLLKAGKNQYMITSREEADLNALGDFKRFSIKPLSIQEAFDLIRRYDQNGDLSEKLIERIKKDEQLSVLKEFLNNPLLTSLLYKTFQYKEEIAYKKLDFYSQVYEALFNDHDKIKGGAYVHKKTCLLDSTDFERLLRRIAFLSLKKNKVEYSNKTEFIQIIQEAIESMPWITTRADRVLYDVTHAVPFFQKDGVAYKWVHKSFMEYFAANFICYENGLVEQLLKKMVLSPNIEYYMNVLDFCYEIKPEIFRKVVIYPFLCRYTCHYNDFYKSEDYQEYKPEYVKNLKFLSFVSRIKLYLYENEEKTETAFDKFLTTDESFIDDKIGKIKIVTHRSLEKVFIAYAPKSDMTLCELLQMKNLDIFERYVYSSEGQRNLRYDDLKEGIFIVNDDKKQWYNSLQNYNVFSDMWYSASDFARKRINKRLDYDKCLKLKGKIEKEIEVQKQIEIDLE